MAQMQALLKIKADVEGEGKVNALGRAIGGLSGTAGKVSGGLKGLAGAAGGLSSVLGALVPIATGAGLAAMAKGAIDAADNMNDLSQKTGVSVESLSKFQQAANASGTSIEGVGAAMIKLNKGLAAGTGPAADALKTLGISAIDASGKLKSTDKVMLEVADKFKSMPDGAQKTALAMQLFGKAGADMIPMLNGGSKAISDLNATMSTDMAKGADRFNDKMEKLKTKAGELGLKIGSLLLPYLEKFVDLAIVASTAFGNLPGPLQAIVVGVVALAAAFALLAPAITAAISLAGLLATVKIGATIAGWAAVAGPAITAITAAFSGLLAWLTGTLVPGLLAIFSGPVGWTVLAVAAVVAMAIAFREPIMQFFSWLGGAIANGVKTIWTLGEPIRKFWVDLWETVKSVTTSFFGWLAGAVSEGVKALWQWTEPVRNAWRNTFEALKEIVEWFSLTAWAVFDKLYRQPFMKAWDGITAFVKSALANVVSTITAAWTSVSSTFNTYVAIPLRNAWDELVNRISTTAAAVGRTLSGVWQSISNAFKTYVSTPIGQAWNAVAQLLPETMRKAADFVKAVWTGLVNNVKNVIRGLLQYAANAINAIGSQINRLIAAFNALPGPYDIRYVPRLSVPAFADGGVVNGPTLAMVGEGGEPEYIIPASKMAKAAANYLNGARGSAVIPAYANGGYIGGGNAQINVTTGPVLQQGGQQYVTMADLEKAMRKTADGVYASLRTPSSRMALGRR